MRTLQRFLPVSVALLLTAGSALATDLVMQPRVYNDIPNAFLEMNKAGSTAFVRESNVSKPEPGGVNRDDFLISPDGATPVVLDPNTAFSIFADVNLTADPTSPRKEAGLRINSHIGGDALFIVNSDEKGPGLGFIGVFGGGAPFWSAIDAGASPYAVGTPITLGMTYGQSGGKNMVQYTVIQNGTTFKSDPKEWDNNEKSILPDSMPGMYFQIGNDPNTPTNMGSATFSNIRFGTGVDARNPALIDASASAVPEPGSLALLGTGLIGLLGLRRRK